MAITLNRNATNDTDLRESNINIDNINTKTGEVQTTPTVNTVLGRLKNIETNTSSLSKINFNLSLKITRPANTTAYTTGDIVNNNGITTLPEFDFSVYGSVASKQIIIKSINITSNRTTGAPRINPFMYFFNANTITGQDLTDNIAFNPSYAEMIAKREVTETNNPTLVDDGSNCYFLMKNNLYDIANLNASSKLYLAMIVSANYTPVSSEKFYVTINGTIL